MIHAQLCFVSVTNECPCARPPLRIDDFEIWSLGVDESRGRFADVTIERCRRCGQRWLHYRYEIEGMSRSGRWYRGAVTKEQATRTTPATAVALLASLAWHLYGGSYFETAGARSATPLDPEHV